MRVPVKRLCTVCLTSLVLFFVIKLTNMPEKGSPERIAEVGTQQAQSKTDDNGCMLLASELKSLIEGGGIKYFNEKYFRTRTSKATKVDTSKDEQKCPHLYKIAREMLDGAKIKLPSETKNTRWKFRESIDLNILARTRLRWTPPWKTVDLKDTINKFQRYNVSASTIRARKHLLTYGHNCCKGSKERAVNKAIEVAKVDYAEALDLSALSVKFQIAHSDVLRRRKGAGYWLWKPYIILKTLLTKMNNGDMLIYQDAGSYFVNDAGPLFKLCMEAKSNILAFHLGYPESEYSKRDAFVLMGMDDPRVYAKGQTQRMANLIVLMKTCETIQFMMEYLAYTSDARVSTDNKNVMGLPNLSNFKGNRHDQTVFSLLSKKWGILELRNPTQCHKRGCGKGYNYAYGPFLEMYNHDRNRS